MSFTFESGISNSLFEVSNRVSKSPAMPLSISSIFTWTMKILYPYNKVLLFRYILVLLNHTKLHILQFHSDLILINLDKQDYSKINWLIQKYLIFFHFYSQYISCLKFRSTIEWFRNEIVFSFFCYYKFDISVFSHIFHDFIKK